jgi:hypothetical protein
MDAPRPVKRHVLSKRTRAVLAFVATAVALAAVIFVGGALSAPKPSEPSSTPAPAQQAADEGERLYAQALSALRSGDTTAAVLLLEKAAAAGNADAKKKLDEVRSSPSGGGSGSGGGVPSTDYLSPVADMRSLLPTSVAGYTLGLVETSTVDAILPLDPLDNRPSQVVSVIVLTVFDKGTAPAAKAYVDALPRGYAKDGSTVAVNGTTARFGTDGLHVAALTFSRGRFAFEVVATTARGNPADVRDTTIAVARAFPAARP